MAFVTLVLLTALLAACGGGTSTATPESGGDPAPTSKTDKVSLALDWFPNSNHAGFYMALEKGYYEDEGLEVNIFVPANPEDVLKTVGIALRLRAIIPILKGMILWVCSR